MIEPHPHGLRPAASLGLPRPDPRSSQGQALLPPQRETENVPSPPKPGERVRGEMRNSRHMRHAHRTAPACKPERALQVRGYSSEQKATAVSISSDSP